MMIASEVLIQFPGLLNDGEADFDRVFQTYREVGTFFDPPFLKTIHHLIQKGLKAQLSTQFGILKYYIFT